MISALYGPDLAPRAGVGWQCWHRSLNARSAWYGSPATACALVRGFVRVIPITPLPNCPQRRRA